MAPPIEDAKGAVAATPSRPAIAVAFEESELGRTNNQLVAASFAPGASVGLPSVKDVKRDRSFMREWLQVYKRQMVDLWRGTYMSSRLYVFLFLALLFGVTYYKVDDSDVPGVIAKIAILYASAGFLGITSLTTGLPYRFRMRPVFYREKAAGFYRPLAYALTLIVMELPWTAFFALLVQSISYFMIGYRVDASAFFQFVLGTAMVVTYFLGVSNAFSALMPNIQIAQILMGVAISIIMLFAGLFIRVGAMPRPWVWMNAIDGLTHGLRFNALPQFPCTASACPTVSSFGATMPQKAFVEMYLGQTYEDRWASFGWLMLIIGVLSVVTLVAMQFLSFLKR